MTFPHIEDQLRFVYFGTDQYNLAGVTQYGNPDREGGAHATGSFGVMPGRDPPSAATSPTPRSSPSCATSASRLSGLDPDTDDAAAAEFELWCSEESPMFADLEAGGTLADLDTAGIADAEGNAVEIIDIGDEPAPGNPADLPSDPVARDVQFAQCVYGVENVA